ncbi:hypothetical protein GH714_025548 [Hevea brasiliensis]|uniref:Uncharacterized protein n=1 Tax=Hevea brasiliensis TaxID=3981 RepID=A0A6A6KRG8_HEVBR|nr:hypothetical protein GH714_025548 [Hevea brasiliensis]
MIMEDHHWEHKLLDRIMEVVERGLKRQEELLLQKLEKYEKSFQEKIDKVVEAIQVVTENVAVFNNDDPPLENSSEEQDVFDETSNKKDKCIEMEQNQDFVFDLSSAREEYEEEKDKDGDDCKLELTMGNAEAKPEILAAQTFGDFPENKKDKGATNNVVTESKWQNLGAKMIQTKIVAPGGEALGGVIGADPN